MSDYDVVIDDVNYDVVIFIFFFVIGTEKPLWGSGQ